MRRIVGMAAVGLMATGAWAAETAGETGWGKAVGGLQTRVVVEKEKFKQGEPIIVQMEARNVTKQAVAYEDRWIDSSDAAYFKVTGPDGKPGREINTTVQTVGELPSGKYAYPVLEAGQAKMMVKRRLDVFYYMGKPGRYEVRWPGTGVLPADLSGILSCFDERNKKAEKNVAVGLPTSGVMVIDVEAVPGGSADGNPVGRVIEAMPAGWQVQVKNIESDRLRDQELGQAKPTGRTVGKGVSMLLVHWPLPGALVNHAFLGTVCVMKGESAVVEGGRDKPSLYLGRGKLGHVYLDVRGNEGLARWNHAAEDIARALEVTEPTPKQAEGPDWGRMMSGLLAESLGRMKKSPAMAQMCGQAKLTRPEDGRCGLLWESNTADAGGKTTFARKEAGKYYYYVSLQTGPMAGSSGGLQLQTASTDKGIKWDGEQVTRLYLVQQLGTNIVITVASDDKRFKKEMNGAIDKTVTEMLRGGALTGSR